MYKNNSRNSNVKPWSPSSKRISISVSPKSKKTYGKTDFMQSMKKTLDEIYNNFSITENGAIGYKTTGHTLLDMNFAVASYRSKSPNEIIQQFRKAYSETPELAMRWLFFVRDVREGLGERRLFRVIFKDIAEHCPNFAKDFICIVPYMGRYDDLWELLDIPSMRKNVYNAISNQLHQDRINKADGKSISLLAKWLPSENTSSEKTKKYARMIREGLHMSSKEYRQTLSDFRGYLDVVERKMSSQDWDDIDYETVPSKANLNYSKAFLRHDEHRRQVYLAAVKNGEAKINSSVLFPHEIVHKYNSIWQIDDALEAMWKNLPDLVKGNGNTMVVADGSGSMCCTVDSKSRVTALEVANALAVYFAERASGAFKNKYITFSSRPQYVDFSKCSSLKTKLNEARKHNEISNTNIEAVFDMILKTAVDNNMSQDEIPQNILVISDMEFDSCVTTNACSNSWRKTRPTTTLFDTIRERYEAHGYKLPKLIFWNVNSRTNTIPVKENDLGVALVSGFSVNILKMVMSNKLDPWEILKETLMVPRYNCITEVMMNYLR